MKKLAIVSTHPIQYYAPVFQLLAKRNHIKTKVFYTVGAQGQGSYDPGFRKKITWDIPLLEGYDYAFVENSSTDPGSHHHRGIINPTLVQTVKGWKPDALLIYGWNYHSHIRLMLRLKGQIPIWLRGDSHLLDTISGLRRFVKRMVLWYVYRHVDLAFYVGTNNKDYYRWAGLKERQLIFAPHAIDNDRFFDTPERSYGELATNWRKQLGFETSDVVVLYAGKLEPKKNPALLLAAVQKYNILHSDKIKLLFVGNGELETSLKSTAEGDKNIAFLDFKNQSQMPVVYRLGNIFCLPSKGPYETWGLAINEALACNIPVIVSDKVGCAVDLVHEGQTGVVFKSDDVEDLLKAIRQMVELVQQGLFQKKPETFIQKWSFEQQVEAIEQQLMLL